MNYTNYSQESNKKLLQGPSDTTSISVISESINPKDLAYYKKCDGCKKLSCVCQELTRSTTFNLRSRPTPNNFKRDLISKDSTKKHLERGYLITPNYSVSNLVYVPYLNFKDKIKSNQHKKIKRNESIPLLKCKLKKNMLKIKSDMQISFENNNLLREKIVSIGIKYLEDHEYRYQRKKMLEILYNLIRRGEKQEYACSIRKKLEEIANFIIRHNKEINFKNFFLKNDEKDNILILRFDNFLKSFSKNNILL